MSGTGLRQRAVNAVSRQPWGHLVVQQRRRMVLSACISFGVNLLYALYNGVLGVMGRSLWFLTMCVYYVMLSTLRFGAILCERRGGAGELFVMRLSGALFVPMGAVLAGMLHISLAQGIATGHGTIVMITIATYTFAKIALAVNRAVKQRKNPSPLLRVICNIGYTEVAVSVLTLERSMLATFGTVSSAESRTMMTLTGAAVCLFVVGLGGAMMRSGRKGGGA
ncbi:hypothetical protein [Feifania hominis]|uniref:Uncharacterized protein n=1 Tax=Feifania hominis TaxID=2763660 RepID=A0A926DFP3_9FIRM|nr:hypothetical protein [Feifania hominis]MBC8536444.1 hypothetical protein [Feifania hominis]